MNVDAGAAKAAGDSNLGRLGFVTASDKVAQFEYKGDAEKFDVSGNGKTFSITFMQLAQSGDAAGGITLLNSDTKGILLNSIA